MAEAHTKHHDYHLVDPSPWPAVGSLSAFVMAVGAITWMHHLFPAAPFIFEDQLRQPADGDRFPRCAVHRFFGQPDQLKRVETGTQAAQPPGRHVPIGIAARPFQQIDLFGQTVQKTCAKLRPQRRVIPCRRRQRLIEFTCFLGHEDGIVDETLRRGLL